MKKLLSLVCILAIGLTAEAAPKKASSASSASSSSQSSYSASASKTQKNAPKANRTGQFGITADLGYFSRTQIVTRTAGGQTTTTTTVDPFAEGIQFNISAGVTYFVLDRLEVGLSLGYNSNKTYLGQDINNDDCYQTVSTFDIIPSVGYHIPLCSWLDFVPSFYTSIGFGSNKQEQQINPYTVQTGSASVIQVGLDIVNFEIRPNKNLGLMLNVGGLYYTSRTVNLAGANNQNKRTLNTFNLSLFGNAGIGVRYYF